jgi:agmatine deiminase
VPAEAVGGLTGRDEGKMIPDHQTNMVFVADTLEPRFPEVFRGLKTILEAHGIPLGIIPGTRDVWVRDYLPIQVAEDRFVQFRYAPDYLRGKYLHLRLDGEIGPKLPWVKSCVRSEIVLDGGNVVRWMDRVIVCNKVFDENPGRKPGELLRALGQVLEVGQVIVIPKEPGDVAGHSDGVVRFVQADTVLVNGYRAVDSRYRAALIRVLEKSGIRVVEVPYVPRIGRGQGIPTAFGCYVNYLQAGKVIIVPIYGLPEDAEIVELFRGSFPGLVVQTLACPDLAAEGGVLNCATWTWFSRSACL